MNIKETIYQTLQKENSQYTPKYHNPSSASFQYKNGRVIGKDLLSLYYKWNSVPPSEPINPQAILRMRLGDGTHIILSQILAKAGIKALSEVAAKMSIPGLKNQISYRVDGLHELNGDLEVLEIKSSTDDAMFAWKNISIQKCGPKEEHLLQVICYLNTVPGVKRARLLYISRDSGEMLEYVIGKDGDSYFSNGVLIPELSFVGIVSRWLQLEKALEAKVEPKPEFKIWLNDEGHFMKVKQIKGEKFKSDWEAEYSPYFSKIYLDPKNYEFATYNFEFKQKGLIK